MKILVVYYSMYGHVLKMARAAAEGAGQVAGVEVVMRRVQDLESNRAKLEGSKHAQTVLAEQQDTPIATMEDLKAADGVIFGTPTRFGNMCAQMKQYFDGALELWLSGALEGKPAGIVASTATTHGGQETTCLTMMAPLLHLGFIIVGVPYSTPGMLHTEGRGGTPYGATTVAGGRNELSPAPEDLEIAKALGRRVADIARKLRG
ncbi:MAG: NAD(P)H:quinone oxidoreductase [Syntrophobacterales bacterium]|jgi:NAD(P)H dehydrogenase (quinone)|nr:NAD(P)H:quinone oxidoreductase [Syntrophobacterales bacterium]